MANPTCLLCNETFTDSHLMECPYCQDCNYVFDEIKGGLSLLLKHSSLEGGKGNDKGKNTSDEMENTLSELFIPASRPSSRTANGKPGCYHSPCCQRCFDHLCAVNEIQKEIEKAQEKLNRKLKKLSNRLKKRSGNLTCMETKWIPVRSLLIQEFGLLEEHNGKEEESKSSADAAQPITPVKDATSFARSGKNKGDADTTIKSKSSSFRKSNPKKTGRARSAPAAPKKINLPDETASETEAEVATASGSDEEIVAVATTSASDCVDQDEEEDSKNEDEFEEETEEDEDNYSTSNQEGTETEEASSTADSVSTVELPPKPAQRKPKAKNQAHSHSCCGGRPKTAKKNVNNNSNNYDSYEEEEEEDDASSQDNEDSASAASEASEKVVKVLKKSQKTAQGGTTFKPKPKPKSAAASKPKKTSAPVSTSAKKPRPKPLSRLADAEEVKLVEDGVQRWCDGCDSSLLESAQFYMCTAEECRDHDLNGNGGFLLCVTCYNEGIVHEEHGFEKVVQLKKE